MSSIWSAVLCQVKGLGFSFQLSVQALMEFWRSGTEVWLPRRIHLVVRRTPPVDASDRS